MGVDVPLSLPSSQQFTSHFEFRCGELLGEGERGRPFLLLLLFGSCLNADVSPHEHWPFYPPYAVSSLGVFVWHFRWFFLLLESSYCRFVLFSISRFEMRISFIFRSRCLWAQLRFLSQTSPIWLSVGLSVTTDYSSSHFSSKA